MRLLPFAKAVFSFQLGITALLVSSLLQFPLISLSHLWSHGNYRQSSNRSRVSNSSSELSMGWVDYMKWTHGQLCSSRVSNIRAEDPAEMFE
jgi:hypothetical protein